MRVYVKTREGGPVPQGEVGRCYFEEDRAASSAASSYQAHSHGEEETAEVADYVAGMLVKVGLVKPDGVFMIQWSDGGAIQPYKAKAPTTTSSERVSL